MYDDHAEQGVMSEDDYNPTLAGMYEDRKEIQRYHDEFTGLLLEKQERGDKASRDQIDSAGAWAMGSVVNEISFAVFLLGVAGGHGYAFPKKSPQSQFLKEMTCAAMHIERALDLWPKCLDREEYEITDDDVK